MVRVPKLGIGDVVMVEWSDPHALPGEWQKVAAKDMSIDGCTSVGLVHKVHADRVTIVCTWDRVLKMANGGMTIPYLLMEKIVVLRRATP